MTNEEAINRLQDAKDGYKEYLTDEALEMAIQALEKENIYDDKEHYVTISKALYDKLNIDYEALDKAYFKGYYDALQRPAGSEDKLNKIRDEIEEYKSRQLTLAIGVDDLENGKQIALEYVLAIIDKYRGTNDKY